MTTIYVCEGMLGADATEQDVAQFIQLLEAELPDNAAVRIVRGDGINDIGDQAIAAAHDRAWDRFCGL